MMDRSLAGACVKAALRDLIDGVKANVRIQAPGRLGPILNTPNAGNGMPRPRANDENENADGWYEPWYGGGHHDPIFYPQRYSRQGPITMNPVYYTDPFPRHPQMRDYPYQGPKRSKRGRL